MTDAPHPDRLAVAAVPHLLVATGRERSLAQQTPDLPSLQAKDVQRHGQRLRQIKGDRCLWIEGIRMRADRYLADHRNIVGG